MDRKDVYMTLDQFYCSLSEEDQLALHAKTPRSPEGSEFGEVAMVFSNILKAEMERRGVTVAEPALNPLKERLLKQRQ